MRKKLCNSIIIRKLSPLESLLSAPSIWGACSEVNRKLTNKFERFSFIGFAYHIFRQFFRNDYITITAYNNKEIAGFCMMRGSLVHRIIVKEKFRGAGIGSRLVPAEAALVYTPFRQHVDGFYMKLGFRQMKTDREGLYRLIRNTEKK